MKLYTRLSTITLLVLVAFLAAVWSPMAGVASTRGRQNTAVGLTAGAVLAGVTGHKTAAIGLGAGAAYAWKRHADARTSEAYKRGYTNGHRRHHHKVHHIAKKRYTAKR